MKNSSRSRAGQSCWSALFRAVAVCCVLSGLGASAFAQVANDEPSGAQELNVLSFDGGFVQGQLCQGATASALASSCAPQAWPDVWYHMSVFPQMVVRASYWDQNMSNGSISLWSGPNASQLTERACTAVYPGCPSYDVEYTTAQGELDVWVRVSSQDPTQLGYLWASATMQICEGGTTEDTCSGATWLCGSPEPIVGALLANATPSPSQPAGLSVPDIWYPVNGRSITVEYDDKSPASPAFVVIYCGWCECLSVANYTTQRSADGKLRVTALLGSGEHGEGRTGCVRIGSASTATDQSVRVWTYCMNDDTPTAQEINIPAGQTGCETVSGQLLLNATSPGYSAGAEDAWASCSDWDWRTVWYHVPVAAGQTVTADYRTSASGAVSIWNGLSPWNLSEQACTLVTPGATQTSASYTAVEGDSDAWIQLAGQDPWQSAELEVCVR